MGVTGTDYGRLERIAFQAESYVLVMDGEHINIGSVIRALYTDHRRLSALDAATGEPGEWAGLIERLGHYREHPLTGGLTLRNPDGPEAAAALTAEVARRKRAEDERDAVVAVRDMMGNLWSDAKERAEASEARVAELEAALARTSEQALQSEIPKGYGPAENSMWMKGYDAAIRFARATLAGKE